MLQGYCSQDDSAAGDAACRAVIQTDSVLIFQAPTFLLKPMKDRTSERRTSAAPKSRSVMVNFVPASLCRIHSLCIAGILRRQKLQIMSRSH